MNHIKQLFVALFLLLSAGTATAAQWKLAKTNLNAAGSKDTLTLKVSDNTVDFSSFQVDFTLPAGVLLSGTPILGELADDHALTWSKRADGSFRCVVYSVRNTEMKAGCRATHSGRAGGLFRGRDVHGEERSLVRQGIQGTASHGSHRYLDLS